MSENDRPFAERFLEFYESCSEDEQQLLDWVFAALPSDADPDADVEGFTQIPGNPVRQPEIAALFTSVSNVLKTRHDTAKNSISNVR